MYGEDASAAKPKPEPEVTCRGLELMKVGTRWSNLKSFAWLCKMF